MGNTAKQEKFDQLKCETPIGLTFPWMDEYRLVLLNDWGGRYTVVSKHPIEQEEEAAA
ncbi:MAG: hypothetical protein RLZZ70_611 [Candidatus Parcubacteria bacterium]